MASSRTKGKGKNSELLARRKAALERAAERMAERRRVAEEAEAERLRQEAAFDDLVADFELAVEDEAVAASEVEEEVARVRERGQVRIDAAKVAAARVVLAMGKAGETVAGCGHRLGVGAERIKELRRLGREDSAGEGSETALGKVKADASERARVPEKAKAGGPGGEQQLDGVRAPGQAGAVSRGEGAAAAAAPAVTAPAAPAVPPVAPAQDVLPTTPPAGPSGAPGGVGGARPGWPESSR
ncbi:hypothetical protein OG413_45450 [Streptomyces sp. NBC_01433]|uniref:hypothetical protein n=1 Tax=Streptomyces sp. NBC_01433 TaxID=2903864 RepID=UPI00224CBFA9|nr:hypothetical protein [Streptomyces sp. NBC_01433]MCX4681356.1 hypothetical protein [Streptomyces sp. NBC_01433]MCX4681706.1 hypothetical protein [Streptomyces sp. NBC_01433]MCX4682432.1 hypothetical protein [Streptomyces sp. NBC_01433]